MKKIILLCLLLVSCSLYAKPFVKGIYITQPVTEHRSLLLPKLKQAKAAGINTIIVDVARKSRILERNIKLIPQLGFRMVARIVMFPEGGTHDQLTNEKIWQERLALAKYAIKLGAQEIQLDYIRYNTNQPPSPENALYVHRVISWFKQQLAAYNVPLQTAVFGETAIKPSERIGQDVQVFADSIDVLAPMLYPSHFDPHEYFSNRPYLTLYNSLTSLRGQFTGEIPFKVYTYIEMANYRYKMSPTQRVYYIRDQIDAVRDAKMDGWYAWSAGNHYKYLFKALQLG